MKKIILVSLAGLVLFLTSCVQQTPTENQNLDLPTVSVDQNTNQDTLNQNQNVNQPIDAYADWQTNSNPLNMPISYKYPANWSIDKKGTLITGAVSGPNSNPSFEVKEERELGGLTSKEAFERERNTNYEAITSEKDIQIAGNDAYQVGGQTLPDASRDYGLGIEKTYIEYQGKIYSISFLDWNNKRVTDSPFYSTYQEILSTFNFTK